MCHTNPIYAFGDSNIQKMKKWALELPVCNTGRSLVSLAKFLMESGTEPGIHNSRIPSDFCLEGKSRWWKLQSCRENEGKLCISILNERTVLSTVICHCIWKKNKVNGYIMKRKIFLFPSFSSSFTDSTLSKISKISLQLITHFNIHGESWYLLELLEFFMPLH